jgi:thiamine kinase-like enzyme
MEDITTHIQRCIREGLGWQSATVVSVEQIKGGYLSNAYVVDVEREGHTTKLFVKEQNEHKWGAERLSDPYATYLTSDIAGRESMLSPKILGTFAYSDTHMVSVQDVSQGKLVQIQECVNGVGLLGLCGPTVAKEIEGREIELGEAVAGLLAEVHAHKYPIERGVRFNEYSRSLRDVIAHPELTLNIFYNFLKDSTVLSGDFRYAYLSEMMRVSEYFSQFSERNALVHGDAWHANILVDGAKLYLIDYSRIVHGEPGMDVGHFYIACLKLAHSQKSEYHIRMANAFLSKYINTTKDDFIKESMVSAIGFTGAVSVIEDFYPNDTDEDRANFISYVFKCLQNKRITEVHSWNEIH